MNKSVLIALVFVAHSAMAQQTPESNARSEPTATKKSPLPTFKAVYTFVSNGYKNDISLTAIDTVDGELKGRFSAGAGRCLYDNIEVSFKEEEEYFVARFSKFPPSAPSSKAWCESLEVVLQLPKKASAFGYAGKIQTFPKGEQSFYGTFQY